MLWPLFMAQRECGLHVEMAVGTKNSNHPAVHTLSGHRLRWFEWNVVRRAEKALSLQNCFYPSTFLLACRDFFRQTDLIHLHVTTYEFFSDLALPLISRLKPVVWTLHDMQPLTGGCTNSFGCMRWRTGCGHCPGIDGHVYLRHDTTRWLWHFRRFIYGLSRFTLVTPSNWLKDLVGLSPLLRKFDCKVIPNGLDLARYKPQSREKARATLGILSTAKVIVCLGRNGYNRQYKGSEFITAALQNLRLSHHVVLLLVGEGNAYELPRDRYTQMVFGWVNSAEQMVELFSAADITLAPSLADNLPGFVQESIACGTPVVGFATGGIPEIVRPPNGGLLVPPGDTHAFCIAIQQLLENKSLCLSMGRRARRVAEQEYSLDRCAELYTELYSTIFSRRHRDHVGVEGASKRNSGDKNRCY